MNQKQQPSPSIGIAYNKEVAKLLRREIQKNLHDGRKAHYLNIPNSKKYWVWISKLPVVPNQSKEEKK